MTRKTYQRILRWRREHRPQYLQTKARNQKKRREAWIKELKGNVKCACGENDPICIDFHHTNPLEKIPRGKQGSRYNGVVGLANYSPERRKEFLKNTIPICSNCHRKGHAGRPRPEHKEFFILPVSEPENLLPSVDEAQSVPVQ